jgi:hypothetical protein
MEQPPSSITMPPDLDCTATTANLDNDAIGSRLGSRHPLFLTTTAMEILFLVRFPIHTAVIDTDPVCIAILESDVDRTTAPELLLLAVFLECVIKVVGTWR